MQHLLRTSLAALAYFASARLGYASAIPHGIVTLWPPSGVMLGILILSERGHWPSLVAGAFAGGFASDLIFGFSPGLAVAAAVANSSESLLAAWLVTSRLGPAVRLNSIRAVVVFTGGAAVLANAVTSFLGAFVVNRGFSGEFARGWFVWWVGDGLGMLIITPVLLAWAGAARFRELVTRQVVAEGAVLLALLLTTAQVALGPRHDWPVQLEPFALFPLLFWAALRFGPAGAATASLALAAVATWNAALGVGPFSAGADARGLDAAMQLYVYLGLASLSSLIPAAVLAERGAATRRLRESEERLQRVLASSGAVIFELRLGERDVELAWMSENVTRILGYSLEETRSPTWWSDNVHPDDRPRFGDRPGPLAYKDGSSDYRFRHRDGRYRWLREQQRVLRDASGRATAVVVAWLDITDWRQLEQQLQQSQKMEAIGQLAGGVAHDFNNLLTVILGEVDITLGGPPLQDPLHRESLEEIRKAGERAALLTRQLLTFSRRQIIEPTTLSLNDIVGGVEKMVRRLIGEDVRVVLHLERGLRTALADAGQLEQVLVNLAVNARDAMPGGGTLTIETANVRLDEAYAESRAGVAPGDYVMLAVSDTGKGMTEEVQAHLFEPFFTTKERGKGTGLGLATCYAIARQFGGHIHVYSEPGVGTTMRVYLPAVLTEEDTGPQPAPNSRPRGTETILLVEDEEQVRRVASRVLTSLGYVVHEVADGEAAIAFLEARAGRVDLLLTDVVLPHMSGRDLAERVAALVPGIRMLFASGYSDDVMLQHRLLEKEVSLLQKPFTADALAAKVRGVLDALPHA